MIFCQTFGHIVLAPSKAAGPNINDGLATFSSPRQGNFEDMMVSALFLNTIYFGDIGNIIKQLPAQKEMLAVKEMLN